MAIMTRARFHVNRLMVTLIFGIRASATSPPPGPGERLKRPGPDRVKTVINFSAYIVVVFHIKVWMRKDMTHYIIHCLFRLFYFRLLNMKLNWYGFVNW